jgi:hypothetical protein
MGDGQASSVAPIAQTRSRVGLCQEYGCKTVPQGWKDSVTIWRIVPDGGFHACPPANSHSYTSEMYNEETNQTTTAHRLSLLLPGLGLLCPRGREFI